MTIRLENIAKKYNNEFIVKGVDYTFASGKSYALIGPNGSGKSTLLQLLAGYLRPTSGSIEYENGTIPVEEFYRFLNITTPYLELIEEFTLTETVEFHLQFKPSTYSAKEIIELAYLDNAKDKLIKNFSSGMKQRLKLALSIFNDQPVLFLDEPTSNLDTTGVDWYLKHLNELTKKDDKLIVIASNQAHEYTFCKEIVDIEQFKAAVTNK